MNNIFDIKYLLFFYLIQLSSLTNNTLGKQLKEYVYENRLLQHIINLIFLFVLIAIFDESKNFKSITISSFIIYIIYLLSTKLDLQFNLLILAGFLIYFFYKKEQDNKNLRINNDYDLDFETKNIIKTLNLSKNKYILGGLLSMLIYFVYIYYNRKTTQYGGGFSYSKFLLF